MSRTAASNWPTLPASHPENSEYMDRPRASSNSYINNGFDLSDILNPPSIGTRDKRMSLDYTLQNFPSHQQPYSQDIDHGLNFHNMPPPPHLSPNYDQTDGLDVSSDHSHYEFFGPNGSGFGGSRYRTNASSSSSLGHSSDPLYSHSNFGSDSMSSYSGSSHQPYDLVTGLPSSYSSGKVSPLTPSDPALGLQNSPGFPSLSSANGGHKDFSPTHSFPELMPDRRPSNVSTASFGSDFHDDFNNGALGLGFPQLSSVPHFPDRMNRF